jgi:FtsH-binding integral membrane protein
MAQLPQPKPAQDKPFIFVIAAVVVVMIGVVGYVFGNSMMSVFSYLRPILIGLVIMTSTGVMVFLGVDMYQRYKAHMKALSFY